MTLMWLVYFAEVVDKAGKAFEFIMGATMLALFISVMFTLIVKFDKNAQHAYPPLFKLSKWFGVLLVFSYLTFLVIPTKDTYYTMLAAYGVEYVATNERVVGIADQSLELLEQTIGNYLEQGEGE